MRKLVLAVLSIIAANSLFAQHIQYRDLPKDKPVPFIKPEAPPPPPVVYHEWPDKCPAAKGSIPILANYVPKEIMLKLREVYEGHLYSIMSLKGASGKMEYKLQVCDKGDLHFHYANENGVVIRKD